MSYLQKKINEEPKKEIQTPSLIEKIGLIPKPKEIKITEKPINKEVERQFNAIIEKPIKKREKIEFKEEPLQIAISETGYKVRSGGKYAIHLDEELPPIESVRPLNEYGEFTTKKIEQEKMQSFYWRQKQKTLAFILVCCSVIFLIMMLATSEYYFGALYSVIIQKFNTLINIIMSLTKGFSGG